MIDIDGNIETDIFYKKTDSHQYLDFFSCHPKHVKTNIPYNMMQRINRIVSNSDRKVERYNEMSTWLIDRNYPLTIINDAIKKCMTTSKNVLKEKISKNEETSLNFIST
jgi:hypothetical protein